MRSKKTKAENDRIDSLVNLMGDMEEEYLKILGKKYKKQERRRRALLSLARRYDSIGLPLKASRIRMEAQAYGTTAQQ